MTTPKRPEIDLMLEIRDRLKSVAAHQKAIEEDLELRFIHRINRPFC